MLISETDQSAAIARKLDRRSINKPHAADPNVAGRIPCSNVCRNSNEWLLLRCLTIGRESEVSSGRFVLWERWEKDTKGNAQESFLIFDIFNFSLFYIFVLWFLVLSWKTIFLRILKLRIRHVRINANHFLFHFLKRMFLCLFVKHACKTLKIRIIIKCQTITYITFLHNN